MYQHVFRPLFFKLGPERAHDLTLKLMQLAGRIPVIAAIMRKWYAAPEKIVQVLGLKFLNPVGLAAGYDKDGLAWRGLACLGFGHIEIGTVTLKPQPGNPPPRIFRLEKDRGIINRMGFPGKGSEIVARNLSGNRPPGLVLGVNLGKNVDTSVEEAAQDYMQLMERFFLLADYLAINISSPNTIGLRQLQGRELLQGLLTALVRKRAELTTQTGKSIPLVVKIAPDLEPDELDDILEVILALNVDGVIATNTTISRSGLLSARKNETGGLSGAPLRQRSTQMIADIYRITEGKLPIIGAGGIMDVSSAREKLDAGASLIQLYTGLVYSGPGLVKEILTAFGS